MASRTMGFAALHASHGILSGDRLFRLLLCAGCWFFMATAAVVHAQPSDSFYSGKTIQFIVSSGPGVTTDIAARLVARYLGKHLPGNPTIVARNPPAPGMLRIIFTASPSPTA